MADNIVSLEAHLREQLKQMREEAAHLKGGGGDNTSGGGMEERVKALEDKFDKIDTKLGTIGTDIAFLRGKFEGAPSAKDFGELKGRVDSLPTTTKVATLLGIAVAIITIVTKWPDLRTLLGP
jgi:hypothetical protein